MTAAPDPQSGFQTGFLTRLGCYRTTLELFAVMLAWSLGLRLSLSYFHVGWSQLTPFEWLKVVAAGLKFDTLVAAMCLVPQVALLTLCGPRRLQRRFARLVLEAGWTIVFAALPALCIAEFLFFDEFDSRLNYIAFEYLVYPTEVCCNIQQSYPIGMLLTCATACSAGMCFAFRGRFLRFLDTAVSPRTRIAFPGAFAVALAMLLTVTRVSDVEVTQNRVANQCALNGVYSFVYHAWTCRFEFDKLYLTMDMRKAYARIRDRVRQPGDAFEADAGNPLDRVVTGAAPRRDCNVVLVLEESLGADFVETLGGKPGLTPNLDALCREGLLFENFYATGNRTARALEAVLTSLPPIPTESILKRDKSEHVYTLANVLAQRGYERLFMTGGRGAFDSVRRFMTANGFNHFFEQKDYENPSFANAWGVADEDLFHCGLAEMDKLAAGKAPFFAVLLTVSNHRPFTYPDGRIERPSSEQTRDNAIQYADWALGRFFREVKTRPYYKDTLFVVMGDHGARVYGKQQFPMKSYRVPVLMKFPDGGHAGERSQTLGCSLDVAPTIMGVLGGDYPSVFFGRDIRAIGPEQGYALMQHNHEVALLTAQNAMTVLGSGRRAWQFRFDPASFELTPQGVPQRDKVLDTIAFYQSAYSLYYGEECYPQKLQASKHAAKAEIRGTSPVLRASQVREPAAP